MAKKYGNIGGTTAVADNKKCFQKITHTGEKELLKKMKISGVTKKYTVSCEAGNSLVLYFNNGNKVKAVVVTKNYLTLQDAIRMGKEEGYHVDIKISGIVMI